MRDVLRPATGPASPPHGAPAAARFGVFSTDALPAHQQFEAWRARVGPMIALTPVSDPRAGFVASNRLWDLSGLAYSPVVGPAVGFPRTEAAIRRDGIDHWMLLTSRRGSATFRFGDRIVIARPGVPVLLPMARPHDGRRTDSEWNALFLPRDTFADLSARLDAASGVAMDTPLGQLLHDFMISLDRTLPAMSADDVARLPAIISPLLAAALGAAPQAGDGLGLEPVRDAVDSARRQRIMQLIRENLRLHTLGPRTLCRLSGLSRSTLYRLFEGSGGVAATIQRARLRAARAALSDPSDRRPIQAIAEDLAFADASTFSRAFRAEFGCAPRDMRIAALVGETPVRLSADAGGRDPTDLVGLLRRL